MDKLVKTAVKKPDKGSERTETTKKRIKDAFITLYAKKAIDKISIQEITNLAGLNRGTFYVYFLDIYDLLEQIEEELYATIQMHFSTLVTTMTQGENISLALPNKEFLMSNHEYLKVLVGQYGKSRLPILLKEIAKKEAKRQLHLNEKNALEKEYLLEFITSANLGVITYWLSNDMDIPIDQLGFIIKNSLLRGPITCLAGLNES